MNERKRTLLALPYLIWMTGFTIIPLALIFVFGLQDRSGAFTLENVLSIFERDHMKALILSLELSLLSTAICLVLAFPLALILREKKVGRGGFITFIFILPAPLRLFYFFRHCRARVSSSGTAAPVFLLPALPHLLRSVLFRMPAAFAARRIAALLCLHPRQRDRVLFHRTAAAAMIRFTIGRIAVNQAPVRQ